MNNNILAIHQKRGRQLVRVLKPRENGEQLLLWQTELTGSEHEVLLAQWLNDDQFIVADESGNVFQGQLSTEQCKKVLQLPGAAYINGGCWLDKEKQEFWYATDFKLDPDSFDEEARLLGWSLPDWEPIANVLLPDYIGTQTLLRRSDGCFLFYRKGSFTKKDRPQGFYCCHPTSGETAFHPIASPPIPLGMYAHKVMTFNTQHDLLLMPCAPEPADNNGLKLNYRLQLVSLKDFSILWQQGVPQLDSPSPYCDEDELDMVLAYIKGKELDDGHDIDDLKDALDNFIELLCGIKLSANAQTVWLHWGDAVQKLTLNPNQQFAMTQSQRFVIKKDPGHLENQPTPLTSLGYPVYSHTLTELEDGSLLTVGMDYEQLDIANPRATVQPDCFEISSRSCAEPKVVVNQKQKKALAQMGKLVIRLKTFTDQAELLNAGQALVEKLQQLPGSASGSMLEPLFIDGNDRQMTELAFARQLLAVDGGAALLLQALEAFCDHEEAGLLRSGDSKPALADVVRALAEHSIRHLPKLVDYFHIINGEHCAQYHIEHTLQFVYDNYNRGIAGRLKYRKFMRSLPWPFNFEEEA